MMKTDKKFFIGERGLLIILSVIASVVIWFYVVNSLNIETTKIFGNIEVIIDGESAGLISHALMVSEPTEPVFINVTVTGRAGAVNSLKNTDIRQCFPKRW